MNFLAHFILSGDNPDLIVGNFVGDGVKGAAMKNFSEGIQRGIRMHRAIDSYTDDHPVVQKSKERLWPKFHHYAGVIVDVYYDHFLARNWSAYSNEHLPTYTQNIYRLLNEHQAILPPRMKDMLPWMMREDWLYHYSEMEGMKRVFNGMASRAKFVSHMEHAPEALAEGYTDFENEFTLFFPDLIAHTAAYREEI
jgi:acyl carrier protein phosphodiesterase